MKRYIAALFTVLGLAFIGLAPSQAQATVTCTTVTATGWPQNQLWFCATPGNTPTSWDNDKTNATQALQKLGSGSISTRSDAKNKLTGSPSRHNFYLFPNEADYQIFCTYSTAQASPAPNLKNDTTTGSNPGCFTHAQIMANNPGFTYINVDGVTRDTVVLDDITHSLSVPYASVGEVTAHEAGHHLDFIYATLVATTGVDHVSDHAHEFGDKISGSTIFLTNGGSIENGDNITVTFVGPDVVGDLPVTYTVTTTGTQPDTNVNAIAIHLASKINATFSILNIPPNQFATANGATVQIKTDSILHYSKVTLPIGGHLGASISSYDWPAFQELTTCGGTIPFEQKLDVNGKQICGSLQSTDIGGTIHNGDHLNVKITDSALGSNSPHTVIYVVDTSQDTTLNLLAQHVASKINNDSLLNGKVSAKATGDSVRITSSTGNATAYVVSVTEVGHETFTLNGVVQNGLGDAFNVGYVGLSNVETLQQAWGHYFKRDSDTSTNYKELFAQETAIIAGELISNAETPDNFLQSGNFQCTFNFVRAIEMWGVRPGKTPALNPDGTSYTGGPVYLYNTPCSPVETNP